MELAGVSSIRKAPYASANFLLLVSRKAKTAICSAKSKTVRHRDIDLPLLGRIRHVITVEIFCRAVQIYRGRKRVLQQTKIGKSVQLVRMVGTY